MDLKEKSEVSYEVKQKDYPSDIEETNFDQLNCDIFKESESMITAEVCHSEEKLHKSFISDHNVDEANDLNNERKVKDVCIRYIHWFQISVPEELNEEDIYDKADSISEKAFVFLKQYLLENEGEKNFNDGGGEVFDIVIDGGGETDDIYINGGGGW